MKIKPSSTCYFLFLASFAVANAEVVTRSSSADSLNLAAAWVPGLPTAGDVAAWGVGSTLVNTLGANQTWGALDLANASGVVSFNGNNTLTLDHVADASTMFDVGANDFSWGTDGIGGAFQIIGSLATAAPGNGNTGTGASWAGSGSVTLSGTGSKNWSTSGSATNGANGVTRIMFTGTLRLRGATTAIETLGGNWFALGGGGGTTAVDGAVAQTGAFRLDTGDAISRGDFILTHGFNNKTLELASLAGTGSIRSDWGVGASLSNRSIHLDQATDTVFAGGIYVHNGSGQRRNLSITKDGAGTLAFIGRLGSSQGVGGNPAALNLAINAGVWQMGDGSENPSPHLNAVNWDAASTLTIGGGGKLRFMTNGETYTWDREITGGSGVVEITNDADPGEGNVVFSAANPGFAGNVDVLAGSLRLGPNLGSGTLTVKSGAMISCGLAATAGVSQVGALVLEGNTESDFRLGVVSDRIEVAGSLVPPAGDTHVINLDGIATTGGSRKLIDYTGPALSAAEFARFALGFTPAGAATYQLINNSADTSLDLQVTLENQVWQGGTDGNWDFATANWAMAGTPGTPVPFNPDHPSLFDDTAAAFNVVVDAFGVTPTSTTFANAANDYLLTGGELAGPGSLVKNGAAKATLAQDLSHSGGTIVNAGSLVLTGASNFSSGGVTVNGGTLAIGAGGATGDLGAGPVTVAGGATLLFQRDNSVMLDYKTTAKLRHVGGSGRIVVDGGGRLFNYTGSTTGFADANSWAGFSGDLTVKGGSEFQTIRNGRTAMGSATVTLGDATTSGTLSQSEGNWTWTNPLRLAGPANTIANRSAGAPRTLKLQGVIAGDGGLAFADLAVPAAMTDVNRGFILTGDNTLGGTLTIHPGVPVRIGGVPGEADVSQSGAGNAGSLGAASVVNHGTLTFSRGDAHTVANAISGAGDLRIGIPAAAGFGDTGSQVVTFTAAASHTGATTIHNGTLLVGTGGAVGGSSMTVEAAGTLGGTGTVTTALTAAGAVAPGIGIGELNITGNTTLSGTLAVELDGSAADRLTVTGDLDLTGASLTVSPAGAGFTEAGYVIASCTGALTGTLSVPPGYAVALQGGQVVLTQGADYGSWLAGYSFAPGADTTAAGDPDGDGLSNQQEYAFALDPTNGGSVNPVTGPLAAGTFTYTRRKPSLTGLTYTIWTSTNLADWTEDLGAGQVATGDGDHQSVAVTLTATTGARLFVRVKAAP